MGHSTRIYNFFSNLCNHEKDFWARCEGHVFATSHGKSACDVIGSAVKRTVAKTSLQTPPGSQILAINKNFTFYTRDLR